MNNLPSLVLPSPMWNSLIFFFICQNSILWILLHSDSGQRCSSSVQNVNWGSHSNNQTTGQVSTGRCWWPPATQKDVPLLLFFFINKKFISSLIRLSVRPFILSTINGLIIYLFIYLFIYYSPKIKCVKSSINIIYILILLFQKELLIFVHSLSLFLIGGHWGCCEGLLHILSQ